MRQKNTGPIIQQEITLIAGMIQLYYRKRGEQAKIAEGKMLAYAQKRLEVCRFGEAKPTCQHCPVHCYQRDYREQMKVIMRFSGPRIVITHPILCIKHAYRGLTRRT